jgi:hypothetical protein
VTAYLLSSTPLLATGTDGGVALTTEGQGAYQRLVDVRSARLNELLSGWQPEQETELREMVDRLSRDLVSAMPRPPGLDESAHVR